MSDLLEPNEFSLAITTKNLVAEVQQLRTGARAAPLSQANLDRLSVLEKQLSHIGLLDQVDELWVMV